MKEPKVHVGILFEPQIEFVLLNTYLIDGTEISGKQVVTYDEGKILWNGRRYEELLFEPRHEQTDAFELLDVTIGINFHWERKEDQRFLGALKIIVENGKLTGINVIRVEDYLTSVISSEMSATASLELLKAHAVISRSWLLAQIQKNKEITETHADYSAFTQTEEELIRALMLSHLTVIYIKQSLGRLSALCGCVVAATGSSCGITWLMGGNYNQVAFAVQNMIANLTGMICDGAKPSCALKVTTGVSTAVLSAMMAMEDRCVTSVEGIIDEDVDQSIRNLTKIGSKGMNETDKLVLEIMTSK